MLQLVKTAVGNNTYPRMSASDSSEE